MNDQQTLLATLNNSFERSLALLNSLNEHQYKVPYSPGANPPIRDSFKLAHEERWQHALFPNKADSFLHPTETLYSSAFEPARNNYNE